MGWIYGTPSLGPVLVVLFLLCCFTAASAIPIILVRVDAQSRASITRPNHPLTRHLGSVIDVLMKDHCVIAMDTRGHGRSTMDATPFTYELYASDAAGLLQEKHISKAAWVGWSDMGIGTLAALMSSANSSLIDRAFVYGASHNPEATNATFSSTAIYQEFITGAIAEYTKLQPTGNITALAEAVTVLESTLPQWTETSFDSITLGDKVTVAHGQYEEAVVLTEPALLHGWIKKSKLVAMTNVSHFAPVQDPAQFAAKVQQFLAT
jgi:hypothetical protein